jgi:diguanylate cyclase (GGDEF)-like protein
MIDLDNFKPMNDKYGHSCGDEMLKYFSSSLRLFLENNYIATTAHNIIFRYGGDEFIVIFPGEKSQRARNTISSIRVALRKRRFIFHGRDFGVTFSAGVASFPDDSENIKEFLEKSYNAMYFSKKNGKGRISDFSSIPFEKVKLVFGNAVSVVAFVLSGLLIFLSMKAMVKNFIFVDKIIKVNIPRPDKLKRIYLKNGSVIEGVIINEQDPIEVKLIMDKGEGMMQLYKADILRITSVNDT